MDYKKRLKEKGLVFKVFAKNELGISAPLFSQYLSGKRDIPIHIEDKLKKKLA